jgi:hypothetical protein
VAYFSDYGDTGILPPDYTQSMFFQLAYYIGDRLYPMLQRIYGYSRYRIMFFAK